MSRSYGYTPRLMQAPEAARYLGMSESKIRSLPIPKKVSGGNRVYDIRDLDNFADLLEYEGTKNCTINEQANAAFEMSA